ncbi:MAG: hypothetical protein HY662_03225, partial [Chloroflexi bacterium]|nr:hypothetical protein [Chloroflexota bacterium]
LRIVLKDPGMPEVRLLQPTITQVQLQRQDGSWITIWSDPAGKTVKLTSDGAEVTLDTVSLEPGTYVGTRLLVSAISVEVDVNRDGDTEDNNVEIVLTEEEFQSLPVKEKPQTTLVAPSAPEKPPEPPRPPAPTANRTPPKPSASTDNETPLLKPPGPTDNRTAPPEPQEPGVPYKIEGGLVYTGKYLDEKHTILNEKYLIPLWQSNFVYGGSGGEIIYDFTLSPLEPKGEQISVKISVVTPAAK